MSACGSEATRVSSVMKDMTRIGPPDATATSSPNGPPETVKKEIVECQIKTERLSVAPPQKQEYVKLCKLDRTYQEGQKRLSFCIMEDSALKQAIVRGLQQIGGQTNI